MTSDRAAERAPALILSGDLQAIGVCKRRKPTLLRKVT